MSANGTLVTVPCPKCYGARTFSVWSHIEGGRCFGCNGAGTIETRIGHGGPGTSPAKPCKVVDLGGEIGQVTIERHGDGFVANHAHGAVWFVVTGGRIADVIVSDGFKARGWRAAAVSGLQRALKVAA